MSQNNRLTRCFQYHLRGLCRASVLYILIFLAVDIILPALLYIILQRQSPNDSFIHSVNSGQFGSTAFWLSTLIFLFVGFIASFREDFNHLLAMNNTRRNQYLSLLPLMLASGLAFSLFGLVFRILEICLESLLNNTLLSADLHDYLQNFTTGSGRLPATAAELLLYFTGFMTVAAFGTLAGILFYRYGKYVMVPFWICFGCSFVIVPIIATGNTWFNRFITWFLGLDKVMPEVPASLHLLGLAGIFIVLGGLFVRRMPQNA